MKFSRFLWACLAVCLSAFPARADMRHYTAEYRLYVAGILIGKADIQLSLSEKNYRLSAHIKPAGAGRLAGQSHVVSTTRGSLQNGQFTPSRLDLSWTSDDIIKSSYMDYQNGAPLKFVSGYEQPDEFKSKNPVDIKTVGPGTVDPFLGMMSPLNGRPLRAACDGERRIFDGRRMAKLQPGESRHLTPREHGFDTARPAVKCQIIWQPIAGYSERSLERAAEFPPIETHFLQIADSGYAAPLNMRGRSRYGRITVYATRFFAETPTPPAAFDIAALSGLK
jgi:hypothetical protein